MRLNKMMWVGGVAIVALAAGAYWMGLGPVGMGKSDAVAFATPGGITLAPHGPVATDRYGVTSAGGQLVYADARGLPLYSYDKDTEAGKSACTGDCAKAWPAAVALPGAKPFGDWSVVTREDGTKQWAYKGKLLYTFIKDAKDAEKAKTAAAAKPSAAPPPAAAAGGNAAAAALGMGKPAESAPLPPGWHIAAFQPAANVAVPDGIAVREVPNAIGQALVDDRGMTLYAFDGDAKHDLTDHWKPLTAPEIANPVGDFSLVSRSDSTMQWAYKGKPLYTFDGDLGQGDANGAGVDKRWHVAVVMRYFMPADVTIHDTPGHGVVLATSSGMTLYNQDRYRYNPGGNSARDGNHRSYVRGRQIGTAGCEDNCTQTWHPLAAPADAQPTGYWDVLIRADGTKQWAYQGYALYTYAGDKKPGDLTGNDIYDYVIGDRNTVKIADGGAAEPALFWRADLP